MTLIALACISAMAMNICVPSLPSMAAYYNTTPSTISLSVTIYLCASAIIQLFSSSLSDQIGRRPVILFSLALFIFESLAIIWPLTVEIFLVLPFVQAFAVTTMVLSRAIVRDTFSKMRLGFKLPM